ncbi:MAG: glycosyltransferase family 4 protein [Coriobacteriia bacterium]|nr:glycosyltransferase family 4 protein [Coriobacteriia bacterium]
MEHHTLALSAALSASYDVTVVACEGGWLEGAARAQGLEVATVPDPVGNFDLQTLLALRRLVKMHRPAIVHSHLGRSDWYAWLATSGLHGMRLVSTEHGISEARPDLYVRGARRFLHERGHALRLRRTDALIAVSNATASALLRRYPQLSNQPPVTIAPGLSSGTLASQERSERVSGEPLRVVVVARLAQEKGVDIAMTGFAAAREMGVVATLELVGSGPCLAELEQLARDLGIEDVVTFAGHSDDVASHLADAHVILLASRADNLPLAIMEGMAAGLPAIVTNVGGNPELVEHLGTGIVVQPEAPLEIGKAIALLASDEQLRLRLGAAARERSSGYDMSHTVTAIGRLYESII